MRKNRRPLADRVTGAAERALAARSHASFIDVLIGIGWLEPAALKQWQQGQIDCLEETIQTGPTRMSEAMTLFRSWAEKKGLLANETQYVARTPQRQALRFSRGGDAAIEVFYRTHWISPGLSGRKRERLVEKASRAPELVAIWPVRDDWTCHRCGGGGNFLIMEDPGPACPRCVGLGDLVYLPAGEALLTRRAKAKSAQYAVVVRFSRTRRRYERRGLLVEPQALTVAQRELDAERSGQARSGRPPIATSPGQNTS